MQAAVAGASAVVIEARRANPRAPEQEIARAAGVSRSIVRRIDLGGVTTLRQARAIPFRGRAHQSHKQGRIGVWKIIETTGALAAWLLVLAVVVVLDRGQDLKIMPDDGRSEGSIDIRHGSFVNKVAAGAG
jgi:hypothetical protein